MLKKLYIKKLIICVATLFAIFLIYLIPNNNNFSFKEEIKYIDKTVKTETIFLMDSYGYLGSTQVITKENELENLTKELIENLIIDSKFQDNIPNGFKPIIPNGTEILSISIDNNTIKIDFSSNLLETKKENEEKIIEAIIYTLTSLEQIENVIIFVDGKVLTYLPQSKKTLPSTLNRSYGINKEYNVDNYKNIYKTTIYYISNYNNNIYYVPVTKINNDDRNKIEIIIDELSSNNVYKTNLMSYLNSDTKVFSSNIENDELSINFNNAIFNDINSKEILEQVIYTISLSINDNYNVSSVVFNVENKEIYKTVLKTIE